MVKEKDDIDDLISQAEMELSDSDIDNLISEAESESPQPQEKPGYLSGINKAMDETALEGAMKNLVPEKYPMQHAVQNLNTLVRIPLSGLGKAVEPITKPLAPISKKLLDDFTYSGGAVEGSFKKNMEKVAPTIQKYKEFEAKHPTFDAATDFVGDVGELAGNVAGIGGAAKVGTAVGKETLKLPSKAGSGLVDAGKNFKLGDLKIKDTIAKKGYGSDLIEKKQNIANTIYEYGLSEGNHQAGAAKAGQILDEIFTKTDDIVSTISKDPAAPKKNPLRAMTDNLNLEALVDIDEEEAAQKFVASLENKFREKGFDQDLTLDKLVEAKKMLDKKGTLFKSGAPVSSEDQLKVAIKKKMYLNLVNQIAEISPELKALNTEAKKLFSAQDALAGAASRTANKDAISLTDWIMGASAVIDPKAIPALVLKKGLAGGRGSNLMLNTGRALKGDKLKTVDDILAGVVKPEPQLQQPITDKRRLLPRQMMGEQTQPFENMEIPIGAKIRNLGEPGDKITDNLAGGRYALPSPEDIKKLYPSLSDEDARKLIYQLNEARLLPAPMIETNNSAQTFQRQMPTLGQRLGSIGDLKGKKLSEVPFKIIKKK